VGADAEIRAWFSSAQQHESGLAVWREIGIGIRLIHFSAIFKPTGTGEAATLVAQRGQDNSLRLSGIPDVPPSPDQDRMFPSGSN
jgi:hypothetical protein